MDDIGRYRIKGELGRGGMGIVYRAYDPVLGREVAIKTLILSELSDPAERDSLRDRLAREARAAAALSHAGIVAIYDVVQQGDVVGLVMERIEGQTLGHLLVSGNPPDLETSLRIVREAAAALDYAHRRGIVHRDIKPANLMIDESGALKVADFGIAKITASHTRTQSDQGMVVGTAGYMAPEQLRGDPVDGRADQFSLAVVTYEMIGRRRPFMGDSLIALTHQVVFEQPPPLSTVRPGFGPAVDALFLKALSKSPAERYPSCAAFAADLETQIRAAVGQPTAVYPQTPVPALTPVQPPPAVTTGQTAITATTAPTATITAPTITAVTPAPRSSALTWVMAVILLAAGVAAMAFGVMTYIQRRDALQSAPSRQPAPAKSRISP